MNVTFPNFFKLIIVLIVVLSTVSCAKKSDLLADYVLSENLPKEKLEELVIEDFSKTNTDQGLILEVLVNDIYSDQENLSN